ncbi:hypothetical protein BO86DRAFT_6485 [Aspergillus japonicus CBS 114.51]|uniref:Uncharacterized protein n=1 Tax=Aspergillus japonicus CBS 114.51 TaxID=1448312 RepID=A0A8T8XJ28_ASPJA|nr:hypothetical protein BO86DRAFT_6485 [Aspergillus japonicus CBS 114.51]RAH87589.1 hypothetical protein BO86DRAFT_6485 [Aspergillus japonicus CBS 114.51]
MLTYIIRRLKRLFTRHKDDRLSLICSSTMHDIMEVPIFTATSDKPYAYGPEALSQLLYIEKYQGIGWGPKDEPYLKFIGHYGQPPERKFTHWSRTFFNTWALPRSMLDQMVPEDEQEYMESRYGFNWSRVSVEARLISVPTCRAHWTMTLAGDGKSINISFEEQEFRYYDNSVYQNTDTMAVYETKDCSVEGLSANVWIPEHLKQHNTCRCVDWLFLNLWNFDRLGFLNLDNGSGNDLLTFLQEKRNEVVSSAESYFQS